MRMNEKDAQIQKILAELGLNDNTSLTSDQEKILQTALDPEEQFLYDVERLFIDNCDK
jgi:hypothetical protein